MLGEVEDALQISGREVEEQSEPAGGAFTEPNMGNGCGQLYVAHPLAADPRACNFHTAAVTDNATVTDALVLPAEALPVLGGTEYSLAEESVLLRAEGAVVDGLRLGNLAVGPATDLFR